MQATKEDLQASNEELETTKEELHSSNEELGTVNAALQARLAEVSRAQSDYDLLLAASGMGFIVLDPELRIQRFTPTASKLIHLMPADIGRPLAHLASNVPGYKCLISDVRLVLETRVLKVVEVQTTQGTYYLLRIQPYQLPQHEMGGAVISFVEIAEPMQREQLLRSK
jgi:two-component system CheB/CheR fusion protein